MERRGFIANAAVVLTGIFMPWRKAKAEPSRLVVHAWPKASEYLIDARLDMNLNMESLFGRRATVSKEFHDDLIKEFPDLAGKSAFRVLGFDVEVVKRQKARCIIYAPKEGKKFRIDYVSDRSSSPPA